MSYVSRGIYSIGMFGVIVVYILKLVEDGFHKLKNRSQDSVKEEYYDITLDWSAVLRKVFEAGAHVEQLSLSRFIEAILWSLVSTCPLPS